MTAERFAKASVIFFAATWLSTCDKLIEKPPELCNNTGKCCRLKPKQGDGGSSFCVSDCSDCTGDANTTAICPEEAMNVNKGCQTGKAEIESPTRFGENRAGVLFALTPEKHLKNLSFWEGRIEYVQLSPDPLDCKKECDDFTPNCTKASGKNADTDGLSRLFKRALTITDGTLPSTELLSQFGMKASDDPCQRGDTIFASSKVTNVGALACNVQTQFELPDNSPVILGINIPSKIEAHWSITPGEVHLSFDGIDPAFVPEFYASQTELNENFGGKFVEFSADASWIRAQTSRGCLAVKYQ